LPTFNFLSRSAKAVPIIKSSKPSPFTSPALETERHLSASSSGTGGFVIIGENADDNSGNSVSSAGDVNGDGLDDLIVGASGANPSSKANAGKSYVIFGKKDSIAINLSAVASGTGGYNDKAPCAASNSR
jgi:hypothetical protein